MLSTGKRVSRAVNEMGDERKRGGELVEPILALRGSKNGSRRGEGSRGRRVPRRLLAD